MPIYEYECTSCGKTSEAMQKFSDPPLKECPCCRGELRKLISMSTFHLKGSGWYVTDYSGKNQSTSSACNNSKSDDSPKVEKKSEGVSTASKE